MESWQIKGRTACHQYDSMESKTCWLSNENPPCHHCSCIYVPQSSSSSLAKSGRGWEGCWPRAHLGTCWENFAHAAKCPVAPRASIYILNYPEIQPHGPSACLDQCLMAAGVRNLQCSNSPWVLSFLCRGGTSQVSEKNVHVCVQVYGCTCVPGLMCVILGSRYLHVYVSLGEVVGYMLITGSFPWLLTTMGECLKLSPGTRNFPTLIWRSTEIYILIITGCIYLSWKRQSFWYVVSGFESRVEGSEVAGVWGNFWSSLHKISPHSPSFDFVWGGRFWNGYLWGVQFHTHTLLCPCIYTHALTCSLNI